MCLAFQIYKNVINWPRLKKKLIAQLKEMLEKHREFFFSKRSLKKKTKQK